MPKRKMVSKRKRREMESAMVKKLAKMKLIRADRLRDFLDGCFDLVGVEVGRSAVDQRVPPRRGVPPPI